MSSYPATIPQKFERDSFQMTYGKNTIRQPMSMGPPKSRSIGDPAGPQIRGTVEMTASEFSTWEAFYLTTINNGADVFDWVHPITGSAADFIYTSEPTIRSLGGGSWAVDMQLEIIL